MSQDPNNFYLGQYNYTPPVPTVTSVPGKIACEVKLVQAIQTKRVGAMVVVDTKQSLAELKVMFPTHAMSKFSLREGDTVMVYAGQLNQAWGTEQFDLDGKTFILVPEESVVMVRATPVPPPYWSATAYGTSEK